MNDEPQYIDVGDEFNIEDNSWRYPDDLENQDIIQEVFHICARRKRFQSKKEARKWRKIDGQLSRGTITRAWVRFCIDWAKTKNATRFTINVEAVASFILNKPKMQDWLKSNPEVVREEITYKVEDLYKSD